MSEISIQVRRITERVKSYYTLFGLNHFTIMRPGRSVIRGNRRLGTDEIECVVSETARGTSVGFYAINSWQGLLYTLPFLFPIILHSLNLIDPLKSYISGNKTILHLNLIKLFTGNSKFDIKFSLIIIIVAIIPFLLETYIQRIRLANLKSRFSFYTRDAIWETRELSPSVLSLRAARAAISHGILLAIIYFAAFATQDNTLNEITKLYRTDVIILRDATTNAFTYSVGAVIGLLSADKALSLREDAARIDKRNRISGSLIERRVEPIIYAMTAASYAAILFTLLMSVTFMSNATIDQSMQLISFSLLGGFIAGIIHQEGPTWVITSYAILIFFTSLILIFRTGDQPEYAFVVILQLFLIPIPFILFLSLSYQQILDKNNLVNREWIYDIFPLMAFYSVYLVRRRKKRAKIAYEAGLLEDIPTEISETAIKIRKELFQEIGSTAYNLARHYFELLLSYTASYEEDKFILIPTAVQLENWWCEKTKQKSHPKNTEMLNYVDQLLWDSSFYPQDGELVQHEKVGKEMVLSIQ